MALTSITRGTNLPNTASKADVHGLVDNAVIVVKDIVNADISASAAIVDTKLATITTLNKVNSSALTTTSKAAGDFLYNTGTAWVRLPVGTAGQRLQVPPLVDYMEYSSDANAQAAYVTNAGGASISQLTENINSGFAWGSIRFWGQGFKCNSGAEIFTFSFRMLRVSATATGTLTAYIYSDSAGSPNSAIATFSSINANTLGASLSTCTFTGSFFPVANTQYYMIVVWTGGQAGESISLSGAGGNLYANGDIRYFDTAWQVIANRDAYFTLTHYELQSYSESTIKTQGSYALKAVAAITDSLNKTLTRTVSPAINLSGVNALKFDIYASRTGANIKIGIHDSGGTTSEKTYTVIAANTWETVTWDISAVTNANKDVIDSIIVTVVNASAANTFYLDNFYVSSPALRWVTP